MSLSNSGTRQAVTDQSNMSPSLANVNGLLSTNDVTGSLHNLHNLDNLNFSVGAVEYLLGSVDANKNGGPDGIPNVFLKNTAGQLAVPLTIIFNKSTEAGIFPSRFREANVTPVFKKGDKTDVTNYRPICILNSFSKIFEKLVHDRVLIFLNDLFDKNQHGFMRGRSTLTNTSIFINSVAKNMEENVETHAIYTDFAKAFDSVSFNILLRKFWSYGVTGNLLRWFESYLKDRCLRVAFCGSFSAPFSPQSGVPQGSVLGPLLFNVFINDLGENLRSSYLLFADDLKIYAKIRSLCDDLVLQNDLVRLSEWCDRNELRLNIGKCKFISFNIKRNPLMTTYYINDAPLEQVTQVNDLGVLLDSKLKFNLHVDNIFRKSIRMLGFVSRIASNFSNIRCMKLLYNSLIRSHLEFQTPSWSPYQSTYKHKIERVQRKFTRHLYYKQYLPYEDYDSRLARLDMIRLEDRRKYFDNCHLHSIIHNPSLTELSSQINYRNNARGDRRQRLFRLSPKRTYYGMMTDPVARITRLYINEFDEIEILIIPQNRLKTSLLDYLKLNQLQNANA